MTALADEAQQVVPASESGAVPGSRRGLVARAARAERFEEGLFCFLSFGIVPRFNLLKRLEEVLAAAAACPRIGGRALGRLKCHPTRQLES